MLVVDDELLVARALQRWLGRRQIEVSVLCQPADFAQHLAQVRPTAVVSDLVMPGVDGITVLRQALELAPEAKRCLLSGSLGLVTKEQRASIEPCLFLSKPWDEDSMALLLGMLEGQA